MFSQPTTSEYAAPAARRPVSSPGLAAIPAQASQAIPPGRISPPQADLPPPAGLPGATTPTSTPPTVPPNNAATAEPNKKPRALALPQRHVGPSLLTKALASARGIPQLPPQQSLDQVQAQGKQDRTFNGSTATSLSRSPQSIGSDNGASDTYNGSLHQGLGGSLPRDASLTFTMPPTAAATTAALSSPASETRLSKFDMSSSNGSQSVHMAHPELLNNTRPRGASLERMSRERWVREEHKLARAHSHSTSPETSKTPTSLSPNQGIHPTAMPGDPMAAVTELRNHFHSRRGEQRLSMGPEKIWSIGSDELGNNQDGQVEKSITEALVGVEPNARSRKASYSLRFFREGLPEDKSKRRENKLGPQSRGPLSPNLELMVEEERGGSADDTGCPGSAHPSPMVLDAEPSVVSRLPHARSFSNQSPNVLGVCESPVQDYFDERIAGPGRADDLRLPPSLLSSDDGTRKENVMSTSSRGVTTEGQQLDERRKSGDSTEVGEHEIGEDSGEDQIKSAVFLPHQGPEDAPAAEHTVSKPRQPTLIRTHSRGDGFHPWLVKADEPEPEDRGTGDGALEIALTRQQELPHTAFEKLDEFAIEDEYDVKPSRPVSQYEEQIIHGHQLSPRKPLEAIELIPYKHQVGGHTTLWRFSRRAVCKQLNNRENEFYETVERDHRDLLTFLPRYIGVLNVTFQRHPRRKSTFRKDDTGPVEQMQKEERPTNGSHDEGQTTDKRGALSFDPNNDVIEEPVRMISQSIQTSHIPIPTVTFDNNWHILPRNLLQPTPSPPASVRGRSTSASAASKETSEAHAAIHYRPSLDDRHANSWGATTVNKKLRNEVFNDAFLKQPVSVQRHRRPHQRTLPRRTVQRILRPSISDSRLVVADEMEDQPGNGEPIGSLEKPRTQVIMAQSDVTPLNSEAATIFEEAEDGEVKDVTGTSAPEPETLAENPLSPTKKRRFSGSGLRRKPTTVTESRGVLKYYEEADDTGYRGDNEDASQPESQRDSPRNGSASLVKMIGTESRTIPAVESNYNSTIPSEATSPVPDMVRIPRPINPKEAQTQHDSRVEYFLLLEDLTAGMKRPCIMDLKMGTRQYGVDANPKKQKSQQRKCAQTTSRELGVRVCGLQVWDASHRSYIFKDKYYGRNLRAGREFQDALTLFLYDGLDYSSVLRRIPTILQKLSQLELIVQRLNGYRFYAASLLMFYDGDASDEQDYDTAVDDSTTDFATDTEETSALRESKKQRKNRGDIDFKIADFANSVTAWDRARGKPCPPWHPDEPDRGFLRGLASLKRYFLKIQRDVRSELGLDPLGRNGQADADTGIVDDEGEVSE